MFKLNPALSFPNVQTQLCKPFILLTILFNKLKTIISKNFLSQVKSGFTKMLQIHIRHPWHIIKTANIFWSTQTNLIGKFDYLLGLASCSEPVLNVSEVCCLSVVTVDTQRLRPELGLGWEVPESICRGVNVGVETLWSYAERNWLPVRRQAGQSP